MVGSFNGKKQNIVPVGKVLRALYRHDFVLCAVQNQDIVRKGSEVPRGNIRCFQLVEELSGDSDFAVKADGDGLIFHKHPLFVGTDNALRENIIHPDRGTAQPDFTERIAVLRNVFQYLIAAEACGVGVAFLRREVLRYVANHFAEIDVAVAERQCLFDVVAVAGRVVSYRDRVFMLFQKMLREPLCCFIVLVTAEAVNADNRAADSFFELLSTARIP